MNKYTKFFNDNQAVERAYEILTELSSINLLQRAALKKAHDLLFHQARIFCIITASEKSQRVNKRCITKGHRTYT